MEVIGVFILAIIIGGIAFKFFKRLLFSLISFIISAIVLGIIFLLFSLFFI